MTKQQYNFQYWGIKINNEYKKIYSTIEKAKLYCDVCKLNQSQIVHVTINAHVNQSRPTCNKASKIKKADYWGWFDNQKNEFTMIYPNYILLKMCFPYGFEELEKTGEGKVFRLNVTENEKAIT